MGCLSVQNVPNICWIGVTQFFQISNILVFQVSGDVHLRKYGKEERGGEKEEEKTRGERQRGKEDRNRGQEESRKRVKG